MVYKQFLMLVFVICIAYPAQLAISAESDDQSAKTQSARVIAAPNVKSPENRCGRVVHIPAPVPGPLMFFVNQKNALKGGDIFYPVCVGNETPAERKVWDKAINTGFDEGHLTALTTCPMPSFMSYAMPSACYDGEANTASLTHDHAIDEIDYLIPDEPPRRFAAAEYCRKQDIDGRKGGSYLPSALELFEILFASVYDEFEFPHAGTQPVDEYIFWSSSEYDAQTAWAVALPIGPGKDRIGRFYKMAKDMNLPVICIAHHW